MYMPSSGEKKEKLPQRIHVNTGGIGEKKKCGYVPGLALFKKIVDDNN